LFIGYGIAGNVSLIAILILLTLAVLPLPAKAWTIPGHMLSAAISFQVLQQENPQNASGAELNGRPETANHD